MGKMTKSELRDILETFLAIRRDNDGDYVTVLDADKDFGHNVGVFFVLSENGDKLQMMSMTDLTVRDSEKAMAFCNRWNTEKSFGQAYFYEGTFRMTFSLSNPADVSQDYLKDSFVRLNLAVTWQFFVAVGKEFD